MSLHADALALLEGWAPPTVLGPEVAAAQAGLRQRYVDLLRARPDACTRSCRPDHLTASTLVVDEAAERVLLTLHAKAGRWFQVGGHCEDGDATLAGAALREAAEESGVAGLRLDPVPVQLSAHEVPFCRGGDHTSTTSHLDVRFLAVAPAGAVHAVSEESLDVRWWPADALPDPDPDLVELVALARARLAGGSPPSSWGGSAPSSWGGSAQSSWGGSTRAAADQPSR